MIKILFSLGFYRSSRTGSVPIPRCDRWFTSQGASKGVIVMAHGMNLLPSRMDELAQFFAESGYEVFRPGFCGHHGNLEELLGVKFDHWEQDAHRIHTEAKAKADALAVPLHLIAYSFSGLIFQVLSKQLPFAKRVYLAPAIAFHFWYRPMMWLVRLIPWLTFVSVIPDGYAASERGGLSAVIAMDKFFLRWKLGEGRENAERTLIWADLKDELVHAKKMRAMAGDIAGWEFRETNVAGSTLPKPFHHLIVDSASLGAAEWQRVTMETKDYINA